MKARLDSPRNADSVEEQAIKFKIEFSDEVGDAQGKDGRTLQIISNVLERFEGMDSEFCIPTFRIKIRKENGQSDHHQVKREIGSFSCSKELAFNVSGSSQTSMYSLRHFSDLSMEDSQKLHLSSRSLSQIESSKILTRRGLKTMAINGVYKILQDRNATEYVFLQKFGMNALSRTDKTKLYHQESYRLDIYDILQPIVDICLINLDLKEEVPPDFEAIKQNILRGSRYRYNLCFKRRKAESLAGVEFNDSDIISHITIRFSKHEDLPFGYKALTETFYGNPIEFPNSDPFTPLSIIYTRMGAGIIKHISIVTERIENAVPPPGFLMLRRSIYGYPANLNAGSEEKNAWICLYKDYSPLFDFDVIESRPEMKYISPILIATQTLDLGICTKALHYLEILITGGFFESEDSEEDINLNFVANCLVDSLSNSNSAELQDQIVCIMQEFFPSYFRSLTPDVFSLLFLSTYRISSRKNRLGIQREIIHRCIDSLYTSIDPCESNNHVEQHHLCRSIVADLVQHVCDVKLFDETSLEFDSLNLFDPSFILMTQRLVKRFAPQNAILARIMYILLTLIKVGSKGRLYQIDLELQYDSLGLIEQLLSQSLKKYRYLEYNCTLIIRKLLLQSLINNILYQNGTHLSRSLNILKLLLINSFHNCVNELEIVISNILLPLIMNPATDFEKLLMLVDFMMEVFSEKAVFFNIFYNYDNIRGIPLFENMVIVICNLTDKCRLPIDKIPFGWKKHCIQNPQALLQFERGLLDTSILILKGMYDWFRTLFTSKLKINQVNTDDPASYRLSDFDFETFQVIQESNGIVDEHRDRGETVCKRFLKQQARREIFNQAIKMLHEDGKSLKKVISFLISSQYIESNARSIAKWIYERYEVLGLENVGEFLGGTGPIEIEPFEHEVRLSYLRMLDFPTNALDEAMRVILTEGGFRLPAESQKIDRILVDLSEVYYERSGEGFRNKDGVYVLSTAILMLNTSLHNPNVKEKDRLSFEMFLSICKGIEDLIFDEKSLKDIYERIKTDGYSIEFSSTVRLESSEVTSSDDSKSNDISISVLQRNKETERIQRKTLTKLRESNLLQSRFFESNSPYMVKSMFELMWSNLFGVLSSILTPQDVCLVPICLNGFKYALSLTVLFDMHIPRNALAKTLAEFSYTHSFEGSTEECLEAIARNDHLEQEWYQSLTASLENNPFECVKLVRKAVETIKSQFVQEANMKKLRELQNLLVSDVNIVHTSRSYLGQGDIYKVASKISRRLYRLFLFNDSLMYCSGSAKTGFKVHRVIQLAYCRVVPFDKRTAHSLGVSNGFQISNPQKTINLVASSLDDMNEWIKEINDAIDCCLEQRQILLKSADRLSEIGLLDEKISKRLHETCAFIGKSNEMLFSTTEYYRYDDRCKLCFKKFSSFCRPKVCNFCEDPVCSSCFTKKAFISKMDNRVPVCDICFMILEKSTQASDSKV